MATQQRLLQIDPDLCYYCKVKEAVWSVLLIEGDIRNGTFSSKNLFICNRGGCYDRHIKNVMKRF
jgi:hypothetical protein